MDAFSTMTTLTSDAMTLDDGSESANGSSLLNITTDPTELIYQKILNEFGPNRDPLYVVLPVTIIYVIIFLTGLIGNISTCIVISRNKSMHTATNYYLFSLAISDLLLLITGLPQEIYSIWSKYPYVFGESFCVIRGLAAETSANATVLTITAFTVERYVAICHPFLSHTMSKLSRAIKLILVIWVVALIFAVPQALQFGLVTHKGIVICTQKLVILEHSFEISTFLFFVTPMTLITVLYVLIGLRLRSSTMMKKERGNGGQSNRPLRGTTRNSSKRNSGTPSKTSRRVLKMLVAVVVAFFICWAPFHAQRLVAIYGTEDNHQAKSPTMLFIYATMTYISGVLYYVSTTINPLLYHIMSNKFREAFKETLARCWGGGRRRAYSSLSRSRIPPRFGLAPQDSTDYSGNSVREESFSSGGLQRFDTLKTGRGRRTISDGSTNTTVDQPSENYLQYTTSVNPNGPTAVNHTMQSYTDKFPCTALHTRPVTANVTHRNDSEIIKCTEMHLRNPSTRMRNSKSDSFDMGNKSGFWYIFKCVALQRDGNVKHRFSPSKTRLTVENETQTDAEVIAMVSCNISNSSLRDVDRGALKDELTAYMEEIYRRERLCEQIKV